MDNITAKQTPRVLNVVGFRGAEISGVRIQNSTFNEVTKSNVVTEADVKLVNCQIKTTAK